MSSPPKHDAWRPYETVRFVLVRRDGRTMKPYRGLVLEEKVMDNRRWLQVAVWVDDGHPHPHLRLDWVPKSHCWPIHVDPNEWGRSD
mgnify:CR=1 FL=1